MAFATTLRNRVLGALIIVSLILIILPSLISRQDQPASSDQNADSTGTLNAQPQPAAPVHNLEGDAAVLAAQEPDYATLLAPEDDLKQNGTAESVPLTISPSKAPKPAVNPAPVSLPQPEQKLTVAAKPQSGTAQSAAMRTKAQNSPAARTEYKSESKPKAVSSAPAKPATEVLVARPKAVAHQQKPAAANAGGTFAVQMGVFSTSANAAKAVQKLQSGGLKAYTRKVVRNGKPLVGVYVGSGRSKEALQGTLNTARAVSGGQGFIVQLQ